MKWQLLHHACWAGDHAEVVRLLDLGANPNQVAPTNWRQTPLGRTLEFRLTAPRHDGHYSIVRTLLDRGADPAVRSTYLDLTPFELAEFGGFEPAAAILAPYREAGPAHPSGMPPLWLAAASRLEEAGALARVRRMLSRDDPNVLWRGATPLTMAAAHAGHLKVAQALLDSGADPNLGVSPFHGDWHLQHVLRAIPFWRATDGT